MSKVIVVIGAQWGDEGKGKIVDLLAERFDVVVPYQRALDHTSEERLGNEKVGTTLRGISPAYEDKAGRRGIRVGDAVAPAVLRARITRNLADANRIIEAYGGQPLDADDVFDQVAPLAERLAPFIADTMHYLNRAAADGRSILAEGAQATLLDVDHGTYPFVTSSTTTAGGAAIGMGLAPHRITGVLGIVRTYTTRVGEGPFPTEMLKGEEELGQMIRERGREYGAVTRRPRRCGWFDAFATAYAPGIIGFASAGLRKL